MKTSTLHTPLVLPVIRWRFVLSMTALALVCSLAAVLWGHLIFQPEGNDWRGAYRPAALAVLAGQSPYTISAFFNPPWILLPMLPLALLPERVGLAIIQAASLIGYGYAARRLGAKWPVLILFLFTPQTLWDANMGNIDWLIALGFVLPPQAGLFLVLLKPQIGAGVALFWLVEAWRRGGVREAVRVFTPVSFAFILSFLLYGPYLLHFGDAVGKSWNLAAAVWPLLLPVGAVLIYGALRERSQGKAILSAVFLSPYVAAPSLAVAVLGLLPAQAPAIIAILGLWLVWLLRGPM